MRVIVIGASAGGTKAVMVALEAIPIGSKAVFMVVIHGSMEGFTLFPKLLAQKIKMKVIVAQNGMPIQTGNVYVALANHHLFVGDGKLYLSNGPRENLFRPSIDVLFRSAAVSFGHQCVGVLLTGRLSDGTAGLEAIKKCGGLTVIQNPATAEYSDMPRNAAALVAIDYVVNIEDMAQVIINILDEKLPPKVVAPASLIRENSIATKLGSQISIEENIGHQVPISCSSCGGPLWKIEDSKINRYRCHVGHAFTEEALLKSQNDALEEALWIAMRTLVEKKMLLERVSRDYGNRGTSTLSETQADKIKEVQKQINKLRAVLQIPD
ncbi:chemotaxis protein CheB [Maribacter sp. X9]|uniref:chemotaxis protein CheB n=1 Tax=Maribacter sp. X9 TaxID=3402159 RepID=UPI003AF35699